MVRTILFDLDGTLLPMDQDVFLKDYFGRLIAKMVPYGYDPERLSQSIWACTEAMIRNDGTARNEEVFWKCFSRIYDENVRKDEPVFQEFYNQEFQNVRFSCGFQPQAADLIRELKECGYTLVLATNPLFPAAATHSRIRWAGLSPEDFSWITTYENSSRCKPNPDYYREILDTLQLQPEECLMVGNDVEEDMIAESVGMQVFLLTDCLINKSGKDIGAFAHGSFSELMQLIRSGGIC